MPLTYSTPPADGATGWGAWLRNTIAAIKSFVDNLETLIGGKAASSHTHSIANVTSLQSTLDAKADATDLTAKADATATSTALAARVRTDTASQGLSLTQQQNAAANIGTMRIHPTVYASDAALLAAVPTPAANTIYVVQA